MSKKKNISKDILNFNIYIINFIDIFIIIDPTYFNKVNFIKISR